MDDRVSFLAQIQAESLELPPNALPLLDRYVSLLYDQAGSRSLVSKGDLPVLYTRHILDSLHASSAFASPPRCALDIGSGGGLPGIPLGIRWPETIMVLLEAREKKAAFLERCVRALELKNVRVACERLEEHARKGEPIYDALFIRAVAEPYRLVDEIAPRCLPGARWVYFAGGGIDRERLISEFERTGRTVEGHTPTARLLQGLV